ERRTYPFTRNNKVVGAFGKDGKLLADGVTTLTAGAENFTAEVAYPGHLWDCNTCHVNNAYQKDLGTLGAVINKPIDPATGVATTDPLLWKVISPKAAACTACHDSGGVQTHVTSVGGATFGGLTQGDYIGGKVLETCDGCHVAGGLAGVDTKHGIK
ncbi:MAG: cytochrome C, partial [Pseudomonadota bacterium]